MSAIRWDVVATVAIVVVTAAFAALSWAAYHQSLDACEQVGGRWHRGVCDRTQGEPWRAPP